MRIVAWIVMALVVALPAAGPVVAHGDKVHVMGVIEKVTADAVTVKTKEGKSVEVKLVATTVYTTSADQPTKVSDLAVGQRVVIHADPKGKDLIAATVKFSNATAASAAAASPRN
jgi:hypothetical protein